MGSPDFRQVFEAELPYVVTTCRRLGVHSADVGDVAQEVFLTVHALLDDYDPSRPIRPWLFAISYRVVLRHRTRTGRLPEVTDEEPDVTDETPLADEQLERSQARAFIRRALERVELGRRAVFVLSDIDGLSVPEIAEALSIPLNTVYSRLRRAREEFAAAVAVLKKKERWS